MGIQNLSVLREGLQRGVSVLLHGPREISPAADKLIGGTVDQLYVSRKQAGELLQSSARKLDQVAPDVAFERAIGGGSATYARVDALADAARGAGKVAPDRIAKVEQLLAEQAHGNLATQDAREALGMTRDAFARWRQDAGAPLPYVRTSPLDAPLALKQVVPVDRVARRTAPELLAIGVRRQLDAIVDGSRKVTSSLSERAAAQPRTAAAGDGTDPFLRRHSGKLAIGLAASVVGGGALLASNDGPRH